MNFSFFVAKRYLFAKKSHNIINIISWLYVGVITIVTAAFIIVLSAFNGIEQLVVSLLNTFDPDLKIEAIKGKTFDSKAFPAGEIKKIPGVAYYTEVLEEIAMISYEKNQHLVTLKGVSDDYIKMSRLDTTIYEGEFVLKKANNNFALLGIGVSYYLNANINDILNPLQVWIPRRSISLSGIPDPNRDFINKGIFPSGVFRLNTEDDAEYIIVPLRFAKEVMEYDDEISSIEIGLSPDSNIEKVQEKIKKIAGSQFIVKNRYQQNDLFYRVMKSEKWITFFIISFIVLIATFNIIGSLSILILDKRKDIAILSSIGANDKTIRRIFMLEGIMISLTGALLGLIIGISVCIIQEKFGIVTYGDQQAYPVSIKFPDIITVILTVLITGFLAAWYPVKKISKKYLKRSLEFR